MGGRPPGGVERWRRAEEIALVERLRRVEKLRFSSTEAGLVHHVSARSQDPADPKLDVPGKSISVCAYNESIRAGAVSSAIIV